LMDITRRDEAFIAEFLTAMRGFQILANRMLPLSCMKNDENSANSAKFVFSTLRELDEYVKSQRPMEERWDVHDWVLNTSDDAIERLCLVADFKADVEEMVQDVDPNKYEEVVEKYSNVGNTYEKWWNTVHSAGNECKDDDWRTAHVWVVNARENAFGDLNEILSKSQGWVKAYEDAINLVYPPLDLASVGITSNDVEQVEPGVKSWLDSPEVAWDRATELCKAACNEWRDKVKGALKDRPTSGRENIIKYVKAMRGFRILANRMLPLKCMGEKNNLTNSTKFVLLTLREFVEKMATKWEHKEILERMMYPEEAGSAHTP